MASDPMPVPRSHVWRFKGSLAKEYGLPLSHNEEWLSLSLYLQVSELVLIASGYNWLKFSLSWC